MHVPCSSVRLVLVGGFLGSGKSTIIAAFAQHLAREGLRCAFITNDQGYHLVDTAGAHATSDAVTEIGGGCFCCRLDELVSSIDRMNESFRPNVILAEPVGSCTDLVATVILPLQEIYRQKLEIAPFAVIVDSSRAYRTFFARGRGNTFSKDINYISQKQLEEAQFIVLNKIDLVSRKRLDRLRKKLSADFPLKKVLEVCAIANDGVDTLFNELCEPPGMPLPLKEIDYVRYGEGEAKLGWLNLTADFPTHLPAKRAEVVMAEIFRAILASLRDTRAQLAHLKVAFEGREGGLAVAQATDWDTKFQLRVSGKTSSLTRLLINLRSEAPPETLTTIVERTLSEALRDIPHEETIISAFAPAPPKPTRRLSGELASK